MDTLSRIAFLPASCNLFLPTTYTLSPFPRALFPTKTSTPLASVLRAAPTSSSVSDVEEDILETFFKGREANGDFISRVSDMFWQRKFISTVGSDIIESNSEDSFFKLSRTQEWVIGDKSAPISKKVTAKILQDSHARQKKLNILKYESLKREILLVSVGMGLACSGYCLITLSVLAAISYAIGVFFRIGIRSEDLQDSLERTIKGCSMSLSSPRLVIPATIFGLWVLSHQYFTNNYFDFQLVPAMFGMFVYKAAVLVQVYRDNEELQLVFPENEDGSSD